MGQSSSKNIINAVTKSIATVTANIIQKTQLSTDQSQIISVMDVEGDVVITGNRFTQTAQLNMKALFDALNTEAAQQQIVTQLGQEAKSLISGLNILQFAKAENVMSTLVDASINLISNISETCGVGGQQFQNITIERVKGDVLIQNNVFDQVSNIFQDCASKAVANSSTIQTLSQQLNQLSTSQAKGISPLFIALIVAAIIGIPVLGVVTIGTSILKYIFPLMLLASAILFVLYYRSGTDEMDIIGFSTFIENSPICNAELLAKTRYDTAAQAANGCAVNSMCQAFDFKTDFTIDGVNTPVTGDNTAHYTSVSPQCKASLGQDKAPVLVTPKNIFKGDGSPAGLTESALGDLYFDTVSAQWYQKDATGWNLGGKVTEIPYSSLDVGTISPLQDPSVIPNVQENSVYVFLEKSYYRNFIVYRFVGGQWTLEKRIPGAKALFGNTTLNNSSGFKYQAKSTWMLYTAIALLIIGVIGTVYAYRVGDKKSE